MASLSLHRPLSSQASTSRRLAQRLASSPSSLPLSSLSISSSSSSSRSFSSTLPTRDEDSEEVVKPEKRKPHLLGEYVPSSPEMHKVGDFVPRVYRMPEGGMPPVAMDRASNDDLWKWARNAGSVWKWPTPGQRNWMGGDVVSTCMPSFVGAGVDELELAHFSPFLSHPRSPAPSLEPPASSYTTCGRI